jgi:hypothetical protein
LRRRSKVAAAARRRRTRRERAAVMAMRAICPGGRLGEEMGASVGVSGGVGGVDGLEGGLEGVSSMVCIVVGGADGFGVEDTVGVTFSVEEGGVEAESELPGA